MRVMVLTLVLSAVSMAQSLGNMQDLSAAYAQARSWAHSAHSSSVTWSEPTWQASEGPSFTKELTKTPEQKALEARTTILEKRIKKLSLSRERWQTALERLQRNQAWQQDLKYWAEESQAAQLGAIMSSVSLLIGASGPLEAAAETHAASAVDLARKLGPSWRKLDRARALLDKVAGNPRLDPKAGAAVKLLLQQHAEIVTTLKGQVALRVLCGQLRKIGDRALDAATTLELADDMLVKQDLALALQLIQDSVIDILKEAGIVKLQRVGFKQAAQITRLASFTIDYCYQAARFYNAWWNVDRILQQSHDQQRTAEQMGRTIVQLTDKEKALKADLARLKAAQAQGPEQQRQLVYEERAKDYHQAYLMGEWFAGQTGIRAPGEPIDKEDMP